MLYDPWFYVILVIVVLFFYWRGYLSGEGKVATFGILEDKLSRGVKYRVLSRATVTLENSTVMVKLAMIQECNHSKRIYALPVTGVDLPAGFMLDMSGDIVPVLDEPELKD